METKTHLKIITGIVVFFGILSILQNILFPIRFDFQIVPELINNSFPSDFLGESKVHGMPNRTYINNREFSLCDKFKEIKREVIEKELFLQVETPCVCEEYYLMRFTRYKLTNIYNLYRIDKAYSIKKEGNKTILSFRIDYSIVRADQKGNILCKNRIK